MLKRKKKNQLDIDKKLLNINKLIHLHDYTLVKSCDKKGKTISITFIDSIEYNQKEELIYLWREINGKKETLNAFTEECISDIKYESERKKDEEVLVVTVSV